MTYPLRHTIIAITILAVSLHISRPATLSTAPRLSLFGTSSSALTRQSVKQKGIKSPSPRRAAPKKPIRSSSTVAPSVSVSVSSRSDALGSPDSARVHHRVEIFAEAGSERGAVRVTLSEAQTIEIVAFNILGKRVADIYSGAARSGINTVSFDLSNFSDGVYICVVRGKNFKTAEKFLIAR
jgi:hypothetical protein